MERIVFNQDKFEFRAFWPSVILWIIAWIVVFANFAYLNWNTQRLIKQTELPLLQQKLVALANMKAEGLQETLDKKQPSYTQAEIEKYIKTIFGKNAAVAIAVSHHECSPKNKQYPKCVAHSDKELSVGVFQINLKNELHLIHAAKVPGKTIVEKVESLKDPHINTLIAFKIFTDSGWGAWSSYKNKSYLLSMKEAEHF